MIDGIVIFNKRLPEKDIHNLNMKIDTDIDVLAKRIINSKKVYEFMDISENTYNTIYRLSVCNLDKVLASDSKIDGAIILLTDVIGLKLEEITNRHIIGAIVLRETIRVLYDFALREKFKVPFMTPLYELIEKIEENDSSYIY